MAYIQRVRFVKTKPGQYREMPWPNGRGVTTELFVHPQGTSVANNTAVWRVSMAGVSSDGPFSSLPEYQRAITIAEGMGFRLKGYPGTDIDVTPGVVHCFSGAEDIKCALIGGECTDLNLFFKPEACEGSLELFSGYKELFPKRGETTIIICLKGKGNVSYSGKRKMLSNPKEAVLFSNPNGGTLLVNTLPYAQFALVRIKPVRSMA